MAQHPPGIRTLFFTEMWERMSYYGMRALLVLFMTASIEKGGMGLSDKMAGAIYGLYVCAVYLGALPGGWIADRLLGQQKAVLWGGIIIALGHFTMAIPSNRMFFLGMLLIVLGTGLLKPSASAVVGQLYPEGGARRDAGFTLFYMGVNLGAFIGPIVCGYLGEKVNWHYGFGAAGVGMVCGIIQYVLTSKNLGEAGARPAHPSQRPGFHWGLVLAAVALIGVIAIMMLTGAVTVDPQTLAGWTKWVIMGVAVAWFVAVFAFGKLDAAESSRMAVVAILFIVSAVFWSGFEQAGSSMNLFGERYTDRLVFGKEVPASWFVSLNALFVLGFAPVYSWMWLRLSQRGAEPSLGLKAGSGLLLLALGFLVVWAASKQALIAGKVGPSWLVTAFLLHTWGELAFSPVGLSFVTKLAPSRLSSQTMGVWFLGASLGNLLAGLLTGDMSGDAASGMPQQFMQVAMIAGGAGVLVPLSARWITGLMRGVK